MSSKFGRTGNFARIAGFGASFLALNISMTQAQTEPYLARAQVVVGSAGAACPALFISFNAPLRYGSSSVSDGGRTVHVRLVGDLANTAGSSGLELIETYPNVDVPGMGPVGISLDSSGNTPVLVLRFSQPVQTPLDIVQAGDSSLVLSGVAPVGAPSCALPEVADNLPLPGEDAAAQTDSANTTTDPEQARIDAVFAQAREAIIAQDYGRAVELLTKLQSLPRHARSADVQELLGVVRERNGQLAHARAEYEIYLEQYPNAEGADRVRQRLASLVTAEAAPTALREAGGTVTGPGGGGGGGGFRGGAVRGAAVPEPERSAFSASLTSYYYLNQGSTVLTDFASRTASSDNRVFNNSLVTTLDMSDRKSMDGYVFSWRISGDLSVDMTAAKADKLRIARAYADYAFEDPNVSLRFGRQTRYDGGIFGRFDGVTLTWPLQENIDAKFTLGTPIDSSADDLFASDRLLFGASIAFMDIQPGLDVSAYAVHQISGRFVDRQAVGVEMQYQNDSTSAFALVDYDIHFNSLNTAKFSGTQVMADQSTFTLSVDYARSPLLSTSNALQGQASTTLAALAGIYTDQQIKQFALDRSATTRSVSVAFSKPVDDTWMASFNGSAFHTSATPASGGVAAVPSTGLEYYISAQLVGNNVFSDRDVFSVTGRYANTAASSSILLDAYRRFQVTDAMRVNTRVKVGYRAIKSTGGSETYAIPSVNIRYDNNSLVDLELEVGAKVSGVTAPGTFEQRNEFFMFAGFSKDF